MKELTYNFYANGKIVSSQSIEDEYFTHSDVNELAKEAVNMNKDIEWAKIGVWDERDILVRVFENNDGIPIPVKLINPQEEYIALLK